MTHYAITSIFNDAMRASRLGMTVIDACPYPYMTPEGKWWRKVFDLAEAAKEVA